MAKSLNSMTGYGRAQLEIDGAFPASLRIEIKTVNARGSDIRFKMPQDFEDLETSFRAQISKKIKRGNVQIFIQKNDSIGAETFELNEAQLPISVAALNTIGKELDAQLEPINVQLNLADMLSSPGLMVAGASGKNEEDGAEQTQAIKKLFSEAIDALVLMRSIEGEKLKNILSSRLSEMQTIVDEVERLPSRTAEALKEKFQTQLKRFLDDNIELDPVRLHQELSVMAIKADVQEELDRLNAHISAALDLLNEGGVVGRKLDFLSQELNREANTLCAKSNDVGMTHQGVELKSLVDQFREQVQNLE